MGIFFPEAFFRGDLFSYANIRLDGGGLISVINFSVLFPVGLFSGFGDIFSEVFFLSVIFLDTVGGGGQINEKNTYVIFERPLRNLEIKFADKFYC